MLELELERVQRLSFMAESARKSGRHPGFDVLEKRLHPFRPVELVAHDRKPDGRKMHTKLVLATALRTEQEQSGTLAARQNLVVSDRPVTLALRRHLHQDMQALLRAIHRKFD